MNYGQWGQQSLAIKTTAFGVCQATWNLTAAEEGDLTIANTDSVTANTAKLDTLNATVTGLGPLVSAQKDATLANSDKLTQLGVKLDTVAAKEQATIDALSTLNDYNRQILTAQQTQAAAAAAGSNYYVEWPALVTIGNASVTVGSGAVTADAGLKVLRVIVSSSTLLGSLLGGGAKIMVYHCASASDLVTSTGAVLLGTYPVASNSSYAVLSGRTVPKGRYLKVQSSNGGCAISLDAV